MNILFWNANLLEKSDKAKNINSCLIEMVIENRIDLLILAEYADDIEILCTHINNASAVQYKPIPDNGGCERIKGIVVTTLSY